LLDKEKDHGRAHGPMPLRCAFRKRVVVLGASSYNPYDGVIPPSGVNRSMAVPVPDSNVNVFSGDSGSDG
jgi:hypothetical protein